MTKKEEIIKAINITDGWAWDRWDWTINGSYGESYYNQFKLDIENLPITEKRRAVRVRSMVISAFLDMLREELGYSRSYIQRVLVDNVDKYQLELKTKNMIDELEETIEEYSK